ncbi:UDP-2,4-diacetamido-2,4,6-trideoxy-beta-L-altropyranose hydrolase [Persephonella sp.]
MENIKVFILTEGSKKIGFGHITRCLSLYQAFEEKGIKPKFIINGDDSIVDLIKDTSYEILDWLTDRNIILDKIYGADIVIIDSYLADSDFYKEISSIAKIPVYIDDNRRIDYPKGVVVNGNIYAKDLNYSKKEGITYLLGTKYTPLRKEFWKVPEKEIRKNVESVMITFGGDDIRSMTPKILKLLSEEYPDLKKNVVIGKGFKNIEEIKYVADKNTNLIYYPDAEGMKKIMLESDIAISAGGQTLYELARVGVPTIAVAVADNQLGNVKGWHEANFIEYAGWWAERYVLKNVKFFLDRLNNFALRKKKSLIGKKFVDGKGSRNIIDFLINEVK